MKALFQRISDRFARIPTLWLIIALLALVAAGKTVLYDTLDPDSFWHLRVAGQLQTDGIGPLVDDLSFASLKTPWTPYSWLAELGMRAIWDTTGFRGAILVQAIVIGAYVLFIALGAIELTRRGRDRGRDNPLAVIIATVFAMYLTLPFLSFRPVTFAFLMLAICGWLLLRDRRMDETSRAVWWIIPITLIVTNCHFFSIVVPLWLAALVVGSKVENERESVKRYGKMLGATLLACCMTPMLPGVIKQMWSYQAGDPMVDAGIIAELRPFWHDPVCTTIVALALGFALINRHRIRIGEWLWLLGSLVLYVRLARFSPAYAPIAAATLSATLPQFEGRALQRISIRIAVACIILCGTVRLAMAFPKSDSQFNAWLNRHAPDAPGYPALAADYVHAHVKPSSGRMINEFSWGGFLAWRLQGQFQVLIDGRTQLYSPGLWKSLYLKDQTESQPILEDARADVAIVPVKRSRFAAVLKQMGWQSAYHDDLAEVLLPPSDANVRAD